MYKYRTEEVKLTDETLLSLLARAYGTVVGCLVCTYRV
jgi:hypothetical protein